MSSATRSKSKDRKAAKGFSKASGHTNSAASCYNPVSGTFHTFETSPFPSANIDSRFRSINDTDDNVGNLSASGAVEYDSVSNAGSWSGGSEDHKEKPSQPPPLKQESVSRADNDKREKMRQKNEKKHQRKKERRAQELHERCQGYLMSRKLESLAQQLVAMGFSQERATMALILNEGNIEESVVCLVEADEEGKLLENDDGGGKLKINISEELARVTEMVARYKTTKQDVERTVVYCEGDLDKAEDILKAQDEPKPEEILDPPTLTNGKAPLTLSQNPLRVQEKPVSTTTQQGRDDKDFDYTKTQALVGSSTDKVAKSMQLLKRIPPPPKSEWPKQQKEKIWPNAGFPSPSQALPPPLKQEPRYAPVTNELKNLQLGSVKEPLIVMQRPQPINTVKQAPTTTNVSSFPPGSAMDWYPNSMDPPKPSGFVQQSPAIAGSVSPNTVNSSNSFKQTPYPSQQQFMQPNISNSMDSQGTVSVNNGGLWSRGGKSPPLAPASSLGLFSGTHTSNGLQVSQSQIDWSTGISKQFDYTNIDWSVGRGSLPSALWSSTSYSMSQNSARTYEPLNYGMGLKSNNIERPVVANGSSASMAGLQTGDSVASSGGSREWTSPFEERDIFGLSRQFVSSPSL